MKIALQIDPHAELNYALDSSLCLGREAIRRGHELFYLPPASVSQHGGAIVGALQSMQLSLEEGSKEATFGPVNIVDLRMLDMLLIRQNPPFDMAYISNMLLLEQLEKQGVRIYNKPASIRGMIEKLIPLQFPQYTPPTLISADIQQIRAFHKEHRDVVIKPLFSYGGKGVFKLDSSGENTEALLELMLSSSREPLVVQKFLKEVYAEEKRIILINGKLEGAFSRIPQHGDIRANTRVGGGYSETTLSKRELEIAEAIGAFGHEHGLMLIGLDVIGDWLIEVNITSPTGLMLLKKIYGTTPEKTFWDAVESDIS